MGRSRLIAVSAVLVLLFGVLAASAHDAPDAAADTYGSVEPIPNPTVLDTRSLRDQTLAVEAAFAERTLACGVVDEVVEVLTSTGAATTINGLNSSFDVGAGGFAGNTSPAFVYQVIDSGPNSASEVDIETLTNSLGYVLSQGSGFLLDGDDPASFDFPANYAVLNFDGVPSLDMSAEVFETVGDIDPELFETDTSGYTQYGRAYLTLQSAVPDEQFIAGYVQAADELGLEYTPVIDGEPSLFQGGAAFPFNDWSASPNGEDYLARIPTAAHEGLTELHEKHLRVTQQALRFVDRFGDLPNAEARLVKAMSKLACRY